MHSLTTTKIVASFVVLAAVVGIAFAVVTPVEAQTPGVTFTRNHSQGQSGGEIMQIQKFLNSMPDTRVAASGAGSPGAETSYFGALTKAAVIKFQNKYASDVLTPVGLTSGTGFWGPSSRAKANALNSGTVPPVTPPTTGGSLMVASASQPANSLAPTNAVRVPFTKFTLTNNSSAAVTVSGVTVERIGLGQDAVFSGVALVDENNLQIGTSKTFNSNHQATVGENMILNPGQTKTFTVAGNMNSSLSSYAGQVVGISVIGVTSNGTITGSLPISGAMHTINASLTIGTATANISTFDPNAAQTKNIGDVGVKFSGVRFTAGSAEDVRIYSIRFRQTGSVSGSDLTNVMVYLDSVAYPTSVSADGRYYTAVFPGGILVQKGFSKDVYIQGDITGSNASGRYAEFDIDKTSDVYIVGQLFGYGVAPTGGSGSPVGGSSHGTKITTSQPWFEGSTFSITGASITTIAKANEVAAQNVAVNVPNQPLGGFVADIKGEPISVQSMVFNVATSGTGAGLLTNVSIVDSNGAVVAGPVDATGAGTTLTFTDTVTFQPGRHIYTLRGKLPSGFTNNGTITLSSTPSSQWTNVTGQTTGNTISLSGQSLFTMNTMTVKAASLQVAVSSSPAAQTVVAGAQGQLLANYQFDASQSGEDIRFSSITLDSDLGDNGTAGSLANLSSCQLWDGATALNTGSNVVNPSTTATTTDGVDVAFTLNNSLTVSKGTIKTIALTCNISSTADASSKYQFGINTTNIGAIAATGVTSSNDVDPTSASGSNYNGQVMTVGTSGTVVVSTDASSPSYAIVAGGTSGNTLGVFKFRASNESVNLQRIGLQLTNTASSSASDLTTVTLWNGATQIGTATFVGANTVATSTLNSSLLLTKDTDVMVTVKGDIATIGTAQPGTTGHLVAVDVLTSGNNTQGTGVQSGSTIEATGSTAVAGVRIFKSFPTVAEETGGQALATSGVADGKLMRFKVTANASGDVGISKFSLTIATTTATVTGINIFAFTDSSYSTPVSGLTADGRMLASNNTAWASSSTELEFYAQTSGAASTTLQVPAGQTRYFEVRGAVSGATSGASITTTLLGDAAYPSLALTVFDGTAATIDGDSNDDMLWSPNTTGTAAVGDADWVNGFGIVGLPSGGITKTRSAN